MESNGARGLARFSLIIMLIASITANMTHAWLAVSEFDARGRMVPGVLWPLVTFLAIEIVTRFPWQTRLWHIIARVLLLGPGATAVITSYKHQQGLLLMFGESEFLAMIGPVTIDGFMIGCTLTLLLARRTAPTAPEVPAATVAVEMTQPPAAPIEAYERAAERAQVAVVPSAPAAPTPDAKLRRAVESLQAGMSVKEAADFSGLSESYVRNYAAVVKALLADPGATIPPTAAKRVKADAVSSIREWARSESVK